MEWEPFIRLFAAAVFAGAIGLDRELRAKPAGLRTNIVVGVASAAFAYVSATAFPELGTDNSRVAAQIVSGVGFLGGGAIFAAGGKPHGLTTAAALWGSAAAGLAAGVGAFTAGIALVVITLLALWPLDQLSRTLLRRRRLLDTQITVIVDDLEGAAAVRDIIATSGASLVGLDMAMIGDRLSLDFVVHGTVTDVEGALESLRASSSVAFLNEGPRPGFAPH